MGLLTVLFWLAMACVLGATCYSVIALYAAFRFEKYKQPGSDTFSPPVSMIKPLYGVDRDLEKNLESFCRQDYPSYEILFAVREENDAAVPIIHRLQMKFPSLPIRLLFTGQPPCPNAKVHAMDEMIRVAQHDTLVINDSDVRVNQQYLRSVVAPLANDKVGLVTCLSRGTPGNTIWSVLELLSMNTQFMPGVLTAWLLMGMKFALGPTMVLRKQQLIDLGGIGRLGVYLADDFVLGELIAQAGYEVILSKTVPDHLVCGEEMKASLQHRLRWERSSRMSRPGGYVGQLFTHSLPLCLLALALMPAQSTYTLSVVSICIAARALVAYEVGYRLLGDATLRKNWWLIPVADLLSFFVWCTGFIGREIVWRGWRFNVLKGGKLVRIGR